uniref:Uncharacterized protein n=1 Tax=Setaria viridis TaxID=4556 RepID=A0A4V6Y7R4_SETVI|nr:hypothetical protein SEVIR_9G278166v2 [Setaria viridis]
MLLPVAILFLAQFQAMMIQACQICYHAIYSFVDNQFLCRLSECIHLLS